MDSKTFNEIPTGWYKALIENEWVLCYKFVKPDYEKDRTHWHFMNIMRDEVLRLANSDHLPDGIVFTPVVFAEMNDEMFTLTSKKEMA